MDSRLFDFPGINPPTFRTFRLLSPLPVCAEFYSARYFVDLCVMPGTAYSEHLVVFMPWQAKEDGRQLSHAGRGIIRRTLFVAFDVHVPSVSEVLFLRLTRQGDAEELAGPHCLIPWKDSCLTQGHFRSAAFYG
jgi:hypothetical protein